MAGTAAALRCVSVSSLKNHQPQTSIALAAGTQFYVEQIVQDVLWRFFDWRRRRNHDDFFNCFRGGFGHWLRLRLGFYFCDLRVLLFGDNDISSCKPDTQG